MVGSGRRLFGRCFYVGFVLVWCLAKCRRHGWIRLPTLWNVVFAKGSISTWQLSWSASESRSLAKCRRRGWIPIHDDGISSNSLFRKGDHASRRVVGYLGRLLGKVLRTYPTCTLIRAISHSQSRPCKQASSWVSRAGDWESASHLRSNIFALSNRLLSYDMSGQIAFLSNRLLS